MMDALSGSAAFSNYQQLALGEQAGILLFKKAQEMEAQQGQQLIQQLEQSVQPHLGQNINMRV
jgi:hypothetical protein